MKMKVALVHDYLITYGGGERVVEALHEIWPEAPLYTALVNKKAMGEFWGRFSGWDVRESWFGRVPLSRRLASPLRFLTPLIWQSFNFDDYDVVITSSAWFNPKGIRVRPGTVHICYLHTPPRYLYGYKTSRALMKYWPVRVYATIVNHFLRLYDVKTAKNVDEFVVNSAEVQKRVEKFYRRKAVVIHPPVDVKVAKVSKVLKVAKGKYFLTGGRLVEAKNFDLVIKAANKMKLALKVYGSGSAEASLRKLAGETVEFMGRVDESELARLYAGAKAFIAAACDEDFGMTLVEANAYGTPVIAYKGGGYVDIVQPNINGVFFEELTVDSLVKAINKFSITNFQLAKVKKSAERFSKERFKKEIKELVERKYRERKGRFKN
jgi:glycosyltransferase involved in cell wall biosynthesis